MISIPIKRPRRPIRYWRNYLTGTCKPCGECEGCIARFKEQVNNERPGHVWANQDGKIVYMEDVVMQAHLDRKLKPNETVIHRNGNPLDNQLENLELVVIPEFGVN